eukprot:gnl/TRDRNA2_/TRDRNA2_133276_c0_seq1.p1 gnl/TRDRNA2_/TRDRNA2_133276_c0~~gnl/TRDRNA2_/TRDRNA2_133276_c0_seq1.p1  ORF type:complete len:128 (+),score=14.71 gnl/TRDRNA2_/TRDRNA2_133276_c0_seq1:598-981(+)
MDRIIFVGRTHMLNEDFERMCRASGLPKGQPFEHKARQQNPPELEHLKTLTSEAHATIRQLLDPDYVVLDKLMQNGLITSFESSEANALYRVVPYRDVPQMSVEEYLRSGNFTWFDDDTCTDPDTIG